MALELKDVAEYIGLKLEDFKTPDEFKTAFDKEFLKQSAINEESEPVKKILGKVFGTLENDIKKVANKFELGIDFESADYIGKKKVNDKLNFIIDTFDAKNKVVIAGLTEKASLGNDDKVKEYIAKLEKATQKAKDNETLLNSTKTEFETYKTNTATEIKNKTLSGIKKEIYSKAKFLPEANDFTKKGFLTSFEEQYNFDIDENENPFITNKKGEKIVSTKTAGAFKTPSELLDEEIIKANLHPKNPQGGKEKPALIINQNNQQQQSGKTERPIARRLG